MLFNSYIYILLFLPTTVIVYFTLNRLRLVHAAKAWLVLSSFFFYSYWNPAYLLLLVTSIMVNYAIGTVLARHRKGDTTATIPLPRAVLSVGIAFNILLLGFFKYADFAMRNLNLVPGIDIPLLDLILPLAISFFTFQQIAYLVDSYTGIAKEYDFMNYCLFVAFFPQLIAGPIVHHSEMMPQFIRNRNKLPDYKNLSRGLLIFAIGLFKKTMIADSLATIATPGFDTIPELTFFGAWVTSLSYTFQLYFDFSGYTDMAIGSAYMVNIKLPLNFNSPYKALNVQDFWRRWHMTLSRWLKEYIYIPLGGNKHGNIRTYSNLFITFIIGGIWHGAGWTFLVWGALHGFWAVLHRRWQVAGLRMPRFLAWPLTFLTVNVLWVFFRATSFSDALKVLKSMAGVNGIVFPNLLKHKAAYLANVGFKFGPILSGFPVGTENVLIILVLSLLTAFFGRNSIRMIYKMKPNYLYTVLICLIAVYSLLNLHKTSEFLYFQF